MNYLALLGFYARNYQQIQEIEGKVGGKPDPLLLAWIEANIAIAQRKWPEYAKLLGDLNSTLAEVIGKG